MTAFDSAALITRLPHRSGVYRMLDAEGTVLYVGKARDLKKRVASYFQRPTDNAKTRALVALVRDVDVTVTANETEALLLENNLIKSLRPRYNITLRDDKSYPYIYLSGGEDFPRLAFHRGARRAPGRYFGPYPSASSVRDTLQLLQKIFPVRQCEDVFFRNRSRPCLQYQIKRCTAPCVNFVTREQYADDMHHAELFLDGKSTQLVDELVRRMERASTEMRFEDAARYRDQIASLRRIQTTQYISGSDVDVDVVAAATREGSACVQVFFVRGGRHLGNKTFYPRLAGDEQAADVVAAFLPQFYLHDPGNGEAGAVIPAQVIVSHRIASAAALSDALEAQCGHRVRIAHPTRGEKARWLALALDNANRALDTVLSGKATAVRRLEALRDALELDEVPQRMECFDISHSSGEATVASCVVFDSNGPLKSEYRRFNIEGITGGDDYAAMRQALTRRYTRLREGDGKIPDLLFIDGGKGQLAQAIEVLRELQIEDVTLVGVAKGEDRKPGLETLHVAGCERALTLGADSPALQWVQQIRDEAHRFAITGHRARRGRARTTSVLEGVPGLGAKRRQMLLKQFGGLREIARAGIEDLQQVRGISRALAQRIFDLLHPD